MRRAKKLREIGGTMAESPSNWRLSSSRTSIASSLRIASIPKREEQRRHAIGALRIEPGIVAVLLVVHVYREERNGEEIIRIIPAREAEKHELRRYQEQTTD